MLPELLADARWVRQLAQRLVGAQDADDLAQDACLQALRRPPEHGDNLRAWFHRVLQNLLRQRRRTDQRRTRREQGLEQPPSEAPDELVERAMVQRTVVDAVLALEEPLRGTVLLRFFEGLPPREVARRMRVPVATVHSRLQRSFARLRRLLDRSCGDRATWCTALLPLPAPSTPLPLPSAAATISLLGALSMNSKALWLAGTIVVGAASLWFASTAFPANEPPPATGEAPAAAAVTAPAPTRAESPQRDELARVPPPVPGARDRTGEPAAPAARTISGHVVDSEGHPLAALQVALFLAQDEEPLARVRSAADGHFQVDSDTREAATVAADAAGWTTVMASRVRAGHVASPALVMVGRSLQLAGRVLDDAGHAIADANVQVTWPGDLRTRISHIADSAEERIVRATTAAPGAFALDAAVVRGAELLVTAEGYRSVRQAMPTADERDLVVTLRRAEVTPGTVQGMVLDARGLPAAGAHVVLGATQVRADEQGNFLLDDDGKSAVLVAAQPGSRRGTVSRPVGGFSPFTVVRLAGVPLTLRGRVVDQQGNGVSGAQVWVADPTAFAGGRDGLLVCEGIAAGCVTLGELRARFERGELGESDPRKVLLATPTAAWPWTPTGSDGTFALGGLEERAYSVRVMDPRTLLMVERSDVAAGGAPVEFVLRQDDLFATVAGTVTSSTGVPIADVNVAVQIDAQRVQGSTMHAQQQSSTRTDAMGRFSLRQVPHRHAYLRLDGDDILPVEYGRGVAGGLFELVHGAAEQLRIEVPVRLHVQVELLDPNSADRLSVLDADGRTLGIHVVSGNTRRSMDELLLTGGKSPVFVVTDRAATLVLLRGDQEVRREALTLRPGNVHTLQF